MTLCLSSGGGEVCLGDMVTGLQGLKNTWVKDRQGCLILDDLCEKKKFFCLPRESSVAMETAGGEGEVVGGVDVW